MIEFTLVGIPALFLTISTIEMSLAMWQYHTLEECATVGARYVITHGADCAGSCSVTVGNVISKIVATGVGLNPTTLNVTLTSASGSTTYNPASSYTSNTTVFPSAADATVGNDVTVTLTYTESNPFMMLWTGNHVLNGGTSYTLGAKSRQRIVY